jgi:hypothetical protein
MTILITVDDKVKEAYRESLIKERIAKAISLLPKNFTMIESGCTRYIFDRKLSVPPNERKWYHTGESCYYYRKVIGYIYERPDYKRNSPSHTCTIEVHSRNPSYDEVLKIVVIELAKHYSVQFIIATYKGEEEKDEGCVKCRYCGQFTHNVTKCEHCSGVPL